MAYVADWKFENNYTDSSASGFNGSAAGSGNSFSSAAPVQGVYNLVLNGSGSMTAGNNLELNYNDPLTINVWVKGASGGTFRTLVSKKADSVDLSPGWSFFLLNNSNVYFNLIVGSGNALQLQKLCDTSGGGWYLVSVTKPSSAAASGVKFYLNGVACTGGGIDHDTLSSNPSSSSNLVVGDVSGGGRAYTGSLDEIIIEKREWSASDILSLYNNPNGVTTNANFLSFM